MIFIDLDRLGSARDVASQSIAKNISNLMHIDVRNVRARRPIEQLLHPCIVGSRKCCRHHLAMAAQVRAWQTEACEAAQALHFETVLLVHGRIVR